MKKILFSACLFIIALTACNNNREAELANRLHNDSLQSIIDARDSEINDLLGTFNEIEDGLRAINEAENRIVLARSGEGSNRAADIKENLAFIQRTMKANKDRIAKLQQQLKDSQFKGTELQKTIANLQQQLQEKEGQLAQLREELDRKDVQISELGEKVNNLNTNVENLTTENTQKTQTISAQDKQLNTAYYAFGTKKELKEQHIISDGQVLRANFNTNYFTKIDIRQTTEFKLYSKSARLLTSHPGGSYTLTQDADRQYVLRVTNPQQFWSTSKYLVVQVK